MVVSRLGHRVLEAELLTGTHVGYRVLIPRIQLSPTDSIHPFTFRRRQYPIRLCYAMTINKSQGQSIKQVALYLSRPVFSHGQLYVALSRVTTPEGLKILDDSEGTPRKTLLLILSTERYSAISRPVSHLQPNPDQYTST